MLGALNRERKVHPPDEVIDRLEQELESVAYCAPEHLDQRNAQVVIACRRMIREYRQPERPE